MSIDREAHNASVVALQAAKRDLADAISREAADRERIEKLEAVAKAAREYLHGNTTLTGYLRGQLALSLAALVGDKQERK